ncbi:MAG: HD domain-containing protein [Candidatus Krumholzibacteria bacterium]|nr:HD domain-containing protein [Candidatus Krumholzibacteria bacterium]
MVKTKIERTEVGIPGVVVFRVEGKLGFHENAKIQRLVEECLKRDIRTVIFDFLELSSLGGGVAKILRDFVDTLGAKGGKVSFVVKNDIVMQFLQDGEHTVPVYRSVLEAASASGVPAAGPASVTDASAKAGPNVICMSFDSGEASQSDTPAPTADTGTAGAESTAAESPDGEAEEIIAEIFGGPAAEVPPGWIDEPTSPFGGAAPQKKDDATVVELNRQLKRRILELKTLFSISADFNAIWDRKKLLDIFLLTSIAQGGVESAVFLENQGESFRPIMSKGVEVDALARLVVSTDAFGKTAGENNVIPLEAFTMLDDTKRTLANEGVEYVCPFRTKDGFSGLVLLGKRISGRGMKEEDFEFLRILVNIAQGAYDNALMFEHEHERTLGIVKTLISIIEENTLLKGTSELVSRYVGMTAKSMDYSEEQFKDLIYGTVLRDMGMVKVSDLILRSPRDLTKEEWEIIKKHPEDGAEMLSRMKFSEHVVDIVRTHHERFNGEGYPFGLRGKEIPLGARIISVVESYAAMIHERPTRPALSEHEALDTLKENYGLRYDREVVMQFARIMEKEIARSVRSGVTAS